MRSTTSKSSRHGLLREADEQQLTGSVGPFEPDVRRINHALEFLDLVGACQRFVAAQCRQGQ
ncbi:DUF6192 family protein [Streptomyces broussonetiae]|uniref:DUF6192 family protein n=1 Tax=Streptomyces broussonetiae TaxID=2686304 RepID=UPI003899BAF2